MGGRSNSPYGVYGHDEARLKRERLERERPGERRAPAAPPPAPPFPWRLVRRVILETYAFAGVAWGLLALARI